MSSRTLLKWCIRVIRIVSVMKCHQLIDQGNATLQHTLLLLLYSSSSDRSF
jgi:hypothetical protein